MIFLKSHAMSIQAVKDFNVKSAATKEKWMYKGLPPVKKTLQNCLLDLQQEINDSVDRCLAGTTYTNEITAEWIYKDKVEPVEVDDYVKISLFAAKQTLSNLIGQIKATHGGLSNKNIKLYRNLIYDLLHDITPFINHYEQKTDPTYDFFTGWKSYATSSFETFMIAKGLFYNSVFRTNPLPYKESQGMASMAIRQSIEIKTKRILGISKINKNKKKLSDYGFKRLFDFIEANNTDIIYTPIDFEILKAIYKWSCAYIHNGDISYLWQTETALSYLKPFFASGTHVGPKTTTSAFGSFQLHNFNTIKANLNTFVGPDYTIEYLPDNQVEALIVSL